MFLMCNNGVVTDHSTQRTSITTEPEAVRDELLDLQAQVNGPLQLDEPGRLGAEV